MVVTMLNLAVFYHIFKNYGSVFSVQLALIHFLKAAVISLEQCLTFSGLHGA